MKIKNIQIRNFRSIKDLKWNINEEGFEVLVGKNSVGKSAIIDALQFFNEQSGGIDKDDKPIDINNPTTEIKIKLVLNEQELEKLNINLNDYYSKNKETRKKITNTILISKRFNNQEIQYKINEIQLNEFIFQDIQKIKEILEQYNHLFNFSKYTIVNAKTPILDQNTIIHDLLAITEIYNRNKKKNKDSEKYQEFFDKFLIVLEIIEKIKTYNKRIEKTLPNFIKFDYNEYGQFLDRVPYDRKVLNREIVKHAFNVMNLESHYFTENKGDHHIINQISKNRDTSLEDFLSRNWLQINSKIEMKFYPDYMVCLINDEFPSTKISQRSFGEKWLLSFLIFIYFHRRLNENLVIIIDEPSMNLHPHAQRKIMKVIEGITEAMDKISFFFTTHSPYLIPRVKLDSISRVVKMKSQGTKIIKFSYKEYLKLKNLRFTRTVATINTIKARLSQMFTISLREGFFGDSVIICEGHTEILSLPVWAEMLNFSFDDNGMILIQASKYEMIDYAEFFAVYKIPVFLIYDNDFDSKVKEKVLKHIETNIWLSNFVKGDVKAFPTGYGSNYFIFSPNYESSLKEADPDYASIESEISEIYGTSGKKGIRARYVALNYQELNIKPPKPIKQLFQQLTEFQDLINEL